MGLLPPLKIAKHASHDIVVRWMTHVGDAHRAEEHGPEGDGVSFRHSFGLRIG